MCTPTVLFLSHTTISEGHDKPQQPAKPCFNCQPKGHHEMNDAYSAELETVLLNESRVRDITIDPLRVSIAVEIIPDESSPPNETSYRGELRRQGKAVLVFHDVRSVAWIMNPGSDPDIAKESEPGRFIKIESASLNHVLLGSFGRLEIVSEKPQLEFPE